jgi:two-component system, OmpR family, response regulator
MIKGDGFLKKALVVDDTKNIRNLLSTCLELNGYTVLAAKNGTEAIEFIIREAFSLAFIDVKMPEMNGTEVLRRIRSMGFTYPVIMMTAYSTVKNAIDCTKLGAVAYLQKPFSADKINDIVNMALNAKDKEDDIYSLIKRCHELIDSNNLQEALKLLKKGLTEDSSNGEIYYLMGKIYEKSNNTVESGKYYATAQIFDYKC